MDVDLTLLFQWWFTIEGSVAKHLNLDPNGVQFVGTGNSKRYLVFVLMLDLRVLPPKLQVLPNARLVK